MLPPVVVASSPGTHPKGYVVGIAQLRDCFLANRDTTDTLISQHPFPYCVEKDQEEERTQGVTLADSALEGEPS